MCETYIRDTEVEEEWEKREEEYGKQGCLGSGQNPNPMYLSNFSLKRNISFKFMVLQCDLIPVREV
jgi:hypothetical protein